MKREEYGYLFESDVEGLLSEASSGHQESVFSDNSVGVFGNSAQVGVFSVVSWVRVLLFLQHLGKSVSLFYK